jgi:hypothetical protein
VEYAWEARVQISGRLRTSCSASHSAVVDKDFHVASLLMDQRKCEETRVLLETVAAKYGRVSPDVGGVCGVGKRMCGSGECVIPFNKEKSKVLLWSISCPLDPQ